MLEDTLTSEKLKEPWLRIGGRDLYSRLIIGIEHYKSPMQVRDVVIASQTEILIFTIDKSGQSAVTQESLTDHIAIDNYLHIGTTSLCRSSDEAFETAMLLSEILETTVIKLDVRDGSDRDMILNEAVVEAAQRLSQETHRQIEILPFIEPDLDLALELMKLNCPALRVMASPIGTGQGLVNRARIERIIRNIPVPIIVEGGIGSVSHVAEAMQLGASAVLVNAAVARATNPALMAAGLRRATEAGYLNYLAIAGTGHSS